MYRGQLGQCCHAELNKDKLTVEELAAIRGKKVYLMKAEVSASKTAIVTGMVILKYASYIKESYPSQLADKIPTEGYQTVNRWQDTYVHSVLSSTFKLKPHQHHYFWDHDRFQSWVERSNTGLELTLSDIRSAIAATNPRVNDQPVEQHKPS
jgi:hypothetical protein